MNDISKFTNTADYLPILNGSIAADLVVLFIVYYTRYFNSRELMKYYETYRLGAVLADVLILVIGMIIARYLYSSIFSSWNIIYFNGLVVIIQVIHDILFYNFFKSVPRGVNYFLDMFKDYAKEVSAGAILGDSFMIIIATLLSSYFAGFDVNTNVILLVVLTYLVPYLLYTR